MKLVWGILTLLLAGVVYSIPAVGLQEHSAQEERRNVTVPDVGVSYALITKSAIYSSPDFQALIGKAKPVKRYRVIPDRFTDVIPVPGKVVELSLYHQTQQWKWRGEVAFVGTFISQLFPVRAGPLIALHRPDTPSRSA